MPAEIENSGQVAVPLSAPQASIWADWIKQPDGVDYHVCEIFEFIGPLDEKALYEAIIQCDQESDSLRLHISAANASPEATLSTDPLPIDFALVDLTHAKLPTPLARKEVESARRQSFDLSRGHHCRHRLIRLAAQHYWWVRVYHHLVMDAFGGVILCGRIQALYNAQLTSSPQPAPTFEPYLKFMETERDYRKTSAYQRDLQYWQSRLADDRPPLCLSATSADDDRLDSTVIRTRYDAARMHTLRRTAHGMGVSLNALLQAAFMILLSRETNTLQPVCFSPMVNRYSRLERRTPGLFAHSMPFGLELTPGTPFAEVALAVRHHHQADLRHMRIAPSRLREAGIGHRALTARSGAIFNAVDFPVSLDFHGVRGRIEIFHTGPIQDMALTFVGYGSNEADGSADLSWFYNKVHFTKARARLLVNRFEALIDGIIAIPDLPWDKLPATGREEQEGIRQWEQGPSIPEPAIADLMPQRIRAAIHRAPEAIALRWQGKSFSYRELGQMASAIAADLGLNGVRPGDIVGLCLHPCPEQIAATLAIISTGAAVMPLDPQLPGKRLERMVIHCHPAALVMHANTANKIPASLSVPRIRAVLPIDPTQPAPSLPAVPVAPESIAFVYHTSGSTGLPKPVLITHGALSAKIHSMVELFGFARPLDTPCEQEEVTCVVTSMSFDPWMEQIMMSLATGNTLWLTDRMLQTDPAAFWRLVVRERVTHLNMAPSQLDSLLQGDIPSETLALQRVVLGGEVLSPSLAARARLLLKTRVWNLYGPTEATVDITGYEVPENTSGPLALGRVLPGGIVRLLDEHTQRVPVGVEGEICIGGACLSAGYLGMEAITAERFILDPFGLSGARLYRSGDRGIWGEDGLLIFRGRLDEQVKVRGQRIELGEVEALLESIPGVDRAVVLHHKNEMGGRLTGVILGPADFNTLSSRLAEDLPEASTPSRFIRVESLPLLPSGKVDRRGLTERFATSTWEISAPSIPATGNAAVPLPDAPQTRHSGAIAGRRQMLQKVISQVWADLLQQDSIDPDANLFEIGAHSLLIPRAQAKLSALAGQEVRAVDIFRYASASALAAFLSGDSGPDRRVEPVQNSSRGQAIDVAAPVGIGTEPIAVVGMGFRFPGADDRDRFWKLLAEGRDATTTLTAEHFQRLGADIDLLSQPGFVARHGVLDDIDRFDPRPFALTLGESREIDPQHRLLLEVAKMALEDACCDPHLDGPVATFAGTGFGAYMLDLLSPKIRFKANADRYAISMGNDKDFAVSRLAYKMGLTGPAIAVSTACSTGLVSVALAVQSLRSNQCRVALAGGASFGLSLAGGYDYISGGIGSPRGQCNPFDRLADGTLGATGAGMVVLKRFTDALADGDTIHGLIRGIGLSNDGAAKAAFTAPSVDGQLTAIRSALADAGVEPESVGFVEGHGTGTALGDPIEVEALNLAYGGARQAGNGKILLGSIKGNLGHLDAASGIASLIKALLALRHRAIPPTCHFTVANPRIPFDQGPFQVNGVLEPWQGAGPLRAGVNNLGLGGTNVHLILEEAPALQDRGTPLPDKIGHNQQTSASLLTLSAASEQALADTCEALAAYFDTLNEDTAPSSPSVEDVAFSLSRRKIHRYRRSVVASTLTQAGQRFRKIDGKGVAEAEAPKGETGVALLFPGQGAQQPGMAAALYQQEPHFRQWLDQACGHLTAQPENAHLQDLKALLLGKVDNGTAVKRLADTALTQPALFILEYGLASLLSAWGIRPVALAGHSIGEYVAAALAGVMSVTAALELVAARGRLMASAEPGAMLALPLNEAEVTALLTEFSTGLSIAALNSPRQCVVSGSMAAIDGLEQTLRQQGRPGKRLAVSRGFHSAQMDSVLTPFRDRITQITLHSPAIPMVSNLTGSWLTDADAMDPDYWVRQLRGTVRFADNLTTLLAGTGHLLVECGPGTTATRLARANGADSRQVLATQPLIAGKSAELQGREAVLAAVGRLWTLGITPDWSAVHPGNHRRIPLPTYRFDRQRCWALAETVASAPKLQPALHPYSDAASITPRPPAHPDSLRSGLKPFALDNAFSLEGDTVLYQVIKLWQEMFGLENIKPGDDFFSLGGDSMLAVRMASRLKSLFGHDIPTTVMFQSQTPAAIARWLEDFPAAGSRPEGNQLPNSRPPGHKPAARREEGLL